MSVHFGGTEYATINSCRQQAKKMSVNQRRTLLSTALGFALENMDVMFLSFSLSSIIAEFHISGGQAGLISSVTNLGMLLGGVVFGIIGDRIGRVKTFTYTIFIFAFATAGICFAQDLTLIYILRFIAGIGAGGEYGVGIALISENFNRNQVGRMSSIAAVGGQIGSVLAAILAAIIIQRWVGMYYLLLDYYLSSKFSLFVGI